MIVLSLGRLKLGLGWRADPVLFSLTLLQPGYRSLGIIDVAVGPLLLWLQWECGG